MQVAYTYDAGPNACLYLLEDVVVEVASLVSYYFPPVDGELEVKGIPLSRVPNQVNMDEVVENILHRCNPESQGYSQVISGPTQGYLLLRTSDENQMKWAGDRVT